jgi:serine/threonine-protein kinase HipA
MPPGTPGGLDGLYDIASSLPYRVHEKKLRLAMKIGGDYGVFPHRNTWPAAGGDLGLEPDALVGRVRELAALALDVFAQATNAPDVAAFDRGLPGRLVDLVAGRASLCMQLIESRGAADGNLARAEPDH